MITNPLLEDISLFEISGNVSTDVPDWPSITTLRFELLLFSICFGPFYFEAIAEAEAVFYMPNPSQVFSFGADVLALSSYFACKKCLLLLE